MFVYVPEMREPDLMVKMAHHVTNDFDLIRIALLQRANAEKPQPVETTERSANT